MNKLVRYLFFINYFLLPIFFLSARGVHANVVLKNPTVLGETAESEPTKSECQTKNKNCAIPSSSMEEKSTRAIRAHVNLSSSKSIIPDQLRSQSEDESDISLSSESAKLEYSADTDITFESQTSLSTTDIQGLLFTSREAPSQSRCYTSGNCFNLPISESQTDSDQQPSPNSLSPTPLDLPTSPKSTPVIQSSKKSDVPLESLSTNMDTSAPLQKLSQIPEPSSEIDGPGSRPRLSPQPDSPDEEVFRPRADILLQRKPRFGPGTSVLTPTAFGKSWRQVSAGFGFQERTRFTNSSDGAVGVGFGIGDPEKLVGLDVNITFTDLSDFFDRGFVSFKLHRRLTNDIAIAAGVNDALGWGDGDVDGPSPYGVITKVFVLRDSTKDPLSRLSVSAGVGTGRYRTVFDTERDNQDPNVFGSVALRVFDPVNIITEWTGQDLTVGLSLRPLPKFPLVITPAFTDITGNAGDGWRFILGAGITYQF